MISRAPEKVSVLPLLHHYRVDELSHGHILTQYNGYDREAALHTVAMLCMDLTEGTIVVYRDGVPTRHIEVK